MTLGWLFLEMGGVEVVDERKDNGAVMFMQSGDDLNGREHQGQRHRQQRQETRQLKKKTIIRKQ